MASIDSFVGLRRYVRGIIDKWELMGIDKTIEEVKEKDDRGLSELMLDLGNDSILKLIGLSEDDIWVYNVVTSSYGEAYEVYDSSTIVEDTVSGYGRFWSDLDDDNKKLLLDIAKYISPGVDLDDEQSRGEFFKFLMEAYPKETNDIINDITNETNNAINNAMSDYVKSEVNSELESLGMTTHYGDSIKMTVNQVLAIYVEKDAYHLSIKKLFQSVFDDNRDSSNIGNFSDEFYNINYEDKYDISSINRSINWNLEKILDATEDDAIGDRDEILTNNKNYLDMIKSITTYFNINTWYKLPKNQNYSFRVDGFDRPELKVNVSLRTTDNQKSFKFTVDNFFKLLYQPELFDFKEVYGFEN